MTNEEATTFLLKDGNLAVPGGRYGRDTADCAPWAIAVSEIVADSYGTDYDVEDLDYAMGLVVNSHDDVETLIRDHGDADHRRLLEDL